MYGTANSAVGVAEETPRNAIAKAVPVILHPTDFSPASDAAFIHAVKIALMTKGHLRLLHVGTEPHDPTLFPQVVGMLSSWGLMNPDGTLADVERQLGVRVTKIEVTSSLPLGEMLMFLNENPTDLLVLATSGREGLPRWLHGSTAERLSRRAVTPTLFLNKDARGFVDPANGQMRLQRIIVPVDHHPRPGTALTFLVRLLAQLGAPDAVLHFLHFGGTPPEIRHHGSRETIQIQVRNGNPVDGIIQAACELDADLIAMPTAGHDGPLDMLRGSTTERVLRDAPCAVLAMPTRLHQL